MVEATDGMGAIAFGELNPHLFRGAAAKHR